jgi:hypothetical protein
MVYGLTDMVEMISSLQKTLMESMEVDVLGSFCGPAFLRDYRCLSHVVLILTGIIPSLSS